MKPDTEKNWTIDQITKSEFFYQKLHEWGLIEIADELECIEGEIFDWDLDNLNISVNAWDKVIHRGIKPVLVFANPDVLDQDPKRISYYRMLAMVSQKSMARVGLDSKKYEEDGTPLGFNQALIFSRHLNKIISVLIEHDEKVNEKEFDLWRGMAAGSQAQGSWQNVKGSRAEVVIKEFIEKKVKEKELILAEVIHGKTKALRLKDTRTMVLGGEPDIGVYKDEVIEIAVEIKGGIDPAGVHERFGAALKSLKRAKQKNSNALTILIMEGISLTPKAREEINDSRGIIDHFFTIEEVLENEEISRRLFRNMSI